MDATDQAFVDQFIPDEGIFVGVIALICWIDPEDGVMHWKNYVDADMPISQVIGLYELGKLEAIRRTPDLFPKDDDG